MPAVRSQPLHWNYDYLPRTHPHLENPELTVRAFSVSEMDNSVYLITMRATGEQVLIDPADDAEELYAFTLDALLNDCPQLELADGEERRVRVMEKEEDFNSIRPRAIGLTGILVTHGHWDHIRAIKELDHLTGAVTSAVQLTLLRLRNWKTTPSKKN